MLRPARRSLQTWWLRSRAGSSEPPAYGTCRRRARLGLAAGGLCGRGGGGTLFKGGASERLAARRPTRRARPRGPRGGCGWGRVRAAPPVPVLTSLLLTSPRSAEAQEELQEFPATPKADSYKFDRQARILTARGNVVFPPRDVTIRADVLVADLQTSLVSAEGHVRLDAAGQSVIADMLTYNLETRTGTLFNAQTEYRSPLVLGAVTLKAEKLASDVKQFVTIRKGFATTCEEPDPVVFVTAAELSIFPDDKIVGRQVSVWVAGHRLFTVPFFMIFLRERRDTRIAPTVGYSDAEGWFIRTSWAYFLNEHQYGFVHADWFERLGVGTGIEHLYKTGSAEGSALLYWLANRQTGGADQHAVVNHLPRLSIVTSRIFDHYDASTY